jgi:hypothetical protein
MFGLYLDCSLHAMPADKFGAVDSVCLSLSFFDSTHLSNLSLDLFHVDISVQHMFFKIPGHSGKFVKNTSLGVLSFCAVLYGLNLHRPPVSRIHSIAAQNVKKSRETQKNKSVCIYDATQTHITFNCPSHVQVHIVSTCLQTIEAAGRSMQDSASVRNHKESVNFVYPNSTRCVRDYVINRVHAYTSMDGQESDAWRIIELVTEPQNLLVGANPQNGREFRGYMR